MIRTPRKFFLLRLDRGGFGLLCMCFYRIRSHSRAGQTPNTSQVFFWLALSRINIAIHLAQMIRTHAHVLYSASCNHLAQMIRTHAHGLFLANCIHQPKLAQMISAHGLFIALKERGKLAVLLKTVFLWRMTLRRRRRRRRGCWLVGWLGWVGLGWVGLGWVGLGWVELGWVGLGWVGLV